MIDRIDHLVLTVRDLSATLDFYCRGLGMRHIVSAKGRQAILFGRQKFNLHEATGEPILPRAGRPTAGSADFCLVASEPLDQVVAQLRSRGLAIELGPVERDGATGPIRSVYLRDPDENLVEICEYPA